jgi:hypothetical protein
MPEAGLERVPFDRQRGDSDQGGLALLNECLARPVTGTKDPPDLSKSIEI